MYCASKVCFYNHISWIKKFLFEQLLTFGPDQLILLVNKLRLDELTKPPHQTSSLTLSQPNPQYSGLGHFRFGLFLSKL